MSFEKKPVDHLHQDDSGEWLEHELNDHLAGVASIAAVFAVEFGNADWAMTAGMLHDLGKYNPQWQEYLRKSSGYMARHYYDLYRWLEAGVANEAMADEELFAHVTSDCQVFFRRNRVDYSSLVRGELQVVPTDEQIPDRLSDFGNLQQEMFLNEVPNFESISEKIRELQDAFFKEVYEIIREEDEDASRL